MTSRGAVDLVVTKIITIRQSTFVDNNSGANGNDIYATESYVTLINTIIPSGNRNDLTSTCNANPCATGETCSK